MQGNPSSSKNAPGTDNRITVILRRIQHILNSREGMSLPVAPETPAFHVEIDDSEHVLQICASESSVIHLGNSSSELALTEWSVKRVDITRRIPVFLNTCDCNVVENARYSACETGISGHVHMLTGSGGTN